jgi:hypothetical protein
MERGFDIESMHVMAGDKLEAVSSARIDLARSDLGEGADDHMRREGLPALKQRTTNLFAFIPATMKLPCMDTSTGATWKTTKPIPHHHQHPAKREFYAPDYLELDG